MKKHLFEKTTFTRMCITEAIISLMKNTDFSKIRISAVVKRAGISRMTFYNYYDSLYSALSDYLNILINEYLHESENKPEIGSHLEHSRIVFSLHFFDKYRDYFLTLAKNNLHSILFDGINQFMSRYIPAAKKYSEYQITCYSGGLLNTFLKWEQNGRQESCEDVATVIHKLYNSLNNS